MSKWILVFVLLTSTCAYAAEGSWRWGSCSMNTYNKFIDKHGQVPSCWPNKKFATEGMIYDSEGICEVFYNWYSFWDKKWCED